jgi:hypothetical protein
MPSDPKLTDSQYRTAAMRLYERGSDDNIEIDSCSAEGVSDTLVSRLNDPDGGSNGAWVKAWVWVPNDEAAKE